MAGTAGHGFGELHVADAGGEAGVRDGTLTQNRGHEVVLDTPAAFQLVGYREKLQCLIRPPGTTDLVPEEVVDQGALTAVQGRRHRLLVPEHCAQAIDRPEAVFLR